MTDKEAIKILKQTGGVINPLIHPVEKYTASQVYEALNLAVKALENQVLTKNNQDSNQGDLISREALKKAIDELFFVDESTVEKVIDNAPTALHDNYSMGYQDGVRKVLSERPQGEWIRTGQKNVYGGVVIKCSHCGTTLITSPERYEFAENYCDMCGAKMEKNNEK